MTSGPGDHILEDKLKLCFGLIRAVIWPLSSQLIVLV